MTGGRSGRGVDERLGAAGGVEASTRDWGSDGGGVHA